MTSPTTATLAALIRDSGPGDTATHADGKHASTFILTQRLNPAISGFEDCAAAALVTTLTTTHHGGRNAGYTTRATIRAIGLLISASGQPSTRTDAGYPHRYTLIGADRAGVIRHEPARTASASRLEREHNNAVRSFHAKNTAPTTDW